MELSKYDKFLSLILITRALPAQFSYTIKEVREESALLSILTICHTKRFVWNIVPGVHYKLTHTEESSS